MIPTLGNISELSQGADSARQGSTSPANTASGGAFGDILNAEAESGAVNGSAGEALLSGEEGGNNLHLRGKDLPVLPPIEGRVAGVADGIAAQGLDEGSAAGAPIGADLLAAQLADLTSSELNPAGSDSALSVAPAAESPALFPLASDAADHSAAVTDALQEVSVEGSAPLVNKLTNEVNTSSVPSETSGFPNPLISSTPESTPLVQAPLQPLPMIDPTLAVIPPVTPPPLSRPLAVLDGASKIGGPSASVAAQSLSGAIHGEKIATIPISATPLAALGRGDATIAVREQIVVDSVELLAGVEVSAAKTSLPPASQAQAPTSILAPVVSESAAALVAAKPTTQTGLPPMSTAVGDPQWEGEMAGRLSVLLKNGIQEASLKLNPPELGRMDIRIATEGDQARISFSVQNPEARDALEQSMPRLREMFEQGGLQLAHSDVSDQSQARTRDDNLDAVDTEGDELSESDSPERQEWLVPSSSSQVDYYV